MAYFSNGTEGMVFDDQCDKCKYGKDPCPVAYVQYNWNYDACNNKTARAILDHLVKDNGECEMFKLFKHDLEIDSNQLELFKSKCDCKDSSWNRDAGCFVCDECGEKI